MKKTTVLLIAFIAIISVSCKKYEEGPSFNILSAKARLVNTWKADQYVTIVGGTETFTAINDNSSTEFKKDGTYTYTSALGSYNGKWEFDSKKENLTTTPDGLVTSASTHKILRLTSSELWLETPTGSVRYITK